MEIVTCAEMKEIERRANERGLSYYQMMENAGAAAARVIMEAEEIKGKTALVFCGKGNNGGDGYVVARKLSQAGASVTVILADGFPKTEDAIKNAALIKLEQILALPLPEISDELLDSAEIVVDAIYGTGFHGELPGNVRLCNAAINNSNAAVYALDIPTGLSGDFGEPDADTVCADCTVVFHRLKPVHVMEEAAAYCGRIVQVSIGID